MTTDLAKTAWHGLSADAAARELTSDPQAGLSAAEAARRLAEYGPNALPPGKKKTLLQMFLAQFTDMLVLVLIGAAVVSAALTIVKPEEGEGFTDAIVILAIVVINAFMGVIQEHKAGRAMDALKKMSIPRCEVVRDGRLMEIDSEEVVPGDVVILREGDYIPADLRLVESANLRVDEASLTGESASVEKIVEPVAADLSLPERVNMAYAGTHVAYGRGRGIAIATGMARQIGQIARMLQEEGESLTPLQRNLAGLGKLLAWLSLAICVAVFVAGTLRGGRFVDMFMTAVSLAVAAIPEGLPAVVTIVLALGVYRMSRRNAIIRKLPAVETLGCVTYICTDKTGTLTENRMVVQQAPTAEELLAGRDSPAARRNLHLAAALCNDAEIGVAGGQERLGDPTELALLDAVQRGGDAPRELRQKFARLAEVPFDSARKRMSTLNQIEARRLVLVKGAPDVLLDHCSSFDHGGQPRPLTADQRKVIHQRINDMAAKALRVLAFAWKDAPGDKGSLAAGDEKDLVFCGLMGMIDPPRAEAKLALQEAASAGVQTIMITGDNLLTAQAVAGELGMLRPGDRAMTGKELEALPEEDLVRDIEHIRVFARVWPEQKLRIVKALQDSGHIAAMTGDGVNDAPAIKKADIGVAMGITGTDVAKETADVVLADDNFATIVKAIEEGRVIFENIRKFVVYLLSCNIGEILVIFVPILLGLHSPLWPVQILLINLITDGLPALALGIDASEPDIMSRRPRATREGILSPWHLKVAIFNAVFITVGALGSYFAGMWLTGTWASMTAKPEECCGVAMTMAFVTLGIAELWRAYSCRSERRNIWQVDPRTNLPLLGALVVSAIAVVAVVLIRPLGEVFKTVPLTALQWLLALAFSLVASAAYETLKFVKRVRG